MAGTSNEGWTRKDVSDWELAGEEPQGLQTHPWLRHSSQRRPWLFKAALHDVDRPLGEDVVEKLASEIACALGVPAAPVVLVTRTSISGCLVETLRPSGWVLQAGQTLLAGVVDDYNPEDHSRAGYNVANVRRALAPFGPPPDFVPTEGLSAYDVFTGYLLFDALIANTDRHDRNWAVLVPPPGVDRSDTLCGSYDHGSGLGFNLSDGQRNQMLVERAIDRWARRAAARQFEHTIGAPRRKLVDIAGEALSLCSPGVRDHWRGAFLSVSDGQLAEIVNLAPELTPTTRRFTVEMLHINRKRVLDVLS